MHTKATCGPKRSAGPFRGQTLLVETMASLVHHAIHGGTNVVFLPPPGDAHIALTESGTERMGGLIQATGFEVVAHLGGDHLAVSLLRGGVEVTLCW